MIQSGQQHNLQDWLVLHELNSVTCQRILDSIKRETAGKPAAHTNVNLCRTLEPELAWSSTIEAMRKFLPDKQSFIDDTFEKTTRIVVDRRGGSKKALTLDNGPGAYPTIVLSYGGEPSDSLIIAHEFGHALQIRASLGKFVPPVMREVCAFLGEGALLSHNRHYDPTQFRSLLEASEQDTYKYFGAQRKNLSAALLRPDTPYKYSWNYPIARYLALQIQERCSRDWIWSLFEGEKSVQDVVRELAIAES